MRCPHCRGKGWAFALTDSNNDFLSSTVVCPYCKGTGTVRKNLYYRRGVENKHP